MSPARPHKLRMIILMVALLFPPTLSSAELNVAPDKYVRSANVYLEAGTAIKPEDHAKLARYDLLVLPAEAQNFNPDLFDSLRELNPDITLLAYVPTKSFNFEYWTDELHQNLLDRIEDDWWLRSSSGEILSVWPGTQTISTVSGWSRELPRYVEEEIWSTDLWDGIFYDEFSTTIAWLNDGNIDLHGNGIQDDPNLANAAWERASVNLLRWTRERLGPEAVIITNGDSAPSVQPFINGRMFESFPTPWEGNGQWGDSFGNYLRLHREVGYQPTFIVGADTNNSGVIDYRQIRFALTSTLMGDGFFSYDYGDRDHGQIWWSDEQNADLGWPIGPAVGYTKDEGKDLLGVWRRDFRNGLALLNSTDRQQTITFDADLERLRGLQDPEVNSGQLTREVTLEPHDGILLLKPVDEIVGSSFPNGSFARPFDLSGQQTRNGFFAYAPPYPGAAQVLSQDLDGDGTNESLVMEDEQIEIRWGDGRRQTIALTGDFVADGASLAAGDLDGDGTAEIVAGAGPGGSPLVRTFGADGGLRTEFPAFASGFGGGVDVAAGDLDGDGLAEVVAGAGPGGSPLVRTFGADGGLRTEFPAFASGFGGGVDVAAGDLDGDGTAEVVAGAGPGGGPHVRIFNRRGRVLSGFFVGDETARGGISVALTDTNHDGRQEIVGLTVDILHLNEGNL